MYIMIFPEWTYGIESKFDCYISLNACKWVLIRKHCSVWDMGKVIHFQITYSTNIKWIKEKIHGKKFECALSKCIKYLC
jgi:hypothetical protein